MIHQKRGLVFAAALGFLFLSTAVRVEALTKPDLKVTELTAERQTTMTVPLRIKVALRILNSGTATGSAHIETRLYYKRHYGDAWLALYDWSSGALGANGGAYYSRTFDFTEGGTYYFKAEVDANNNVAEYSEGNNTKTLTKTFTAGTPDLTPLNLIATITSTSSSGTSYVKVEWDVKNFGDGKASRSTPYTDFNTLRFKVITDETHLIQERMEGNNTLHSNSVTKRP
ncbi:MAG: hypothetical protein NTW38_07550 [Candidatus Aminicenantes bacterium]|nr:hypothetical protein [Candidatus Aminicenantes bacterium]